VFDRNRGKIKAAAVREFLRACPSSRWNARRAPSPSPRPKLLRPDALAVWRRWRAKGAKLVIVTASPEMVVAPFARGLGADLLIGSRLM
jgi:phosphatidylglycerophosphatase C